MTSRDPREYVITGPFPEDKATEMTEDQMREMFPGLYAPRVTVEHGEGWAAEVERSREERDGAIIDRTVYNAVGGQPKMMTSAWAVGAFEEDHLIPYLPNPTPPPAESSRVAFDPGADRFYVSGGPGRGRFVGEERVKALIDLAKLHGLAKAVGRYVETYGREEARAALCVLSGIAGAAPSRIAMNAQMFDVLYGVDGPRVVAVVEGPDPREAMDGLASAMQRAGEAASRAALGLQNFGDAYRSEPSPARKLPPWRGEQWKRKGRKHVPAVRGRR